MFLFNHVVHVCRVFLGLFYQLFRTGSCRWKFCPKWGYFHEVREAPAGPLLCFCEFGQL